MTRSRIEIETYKHKSKQGVLPVSLCSKCGVKTSTTFYKVWEIDSFSRADDDYLGIICADCKKTYLR